jgi:hypothetical protein
MVMMKASGFYTSSKLPYLDTQLVNNYANAKRFGKIPFMYHFAGGADPLAEAKYFVEAVSPLTEGDGYALDFEIDIPNPVQWVLVFVNHVHDVTGCWPWVYIDRSRREAFNWSQVFSLCGEWIAAPDVSFDGNIPGVGVYIAQQGPIVNGVDTDEYFGTLQSLERYTYHAQAQTPAPEPLPQPTPTPQPAPTPTESPSVPAEVAPAPTETQPQEPVTPPVPVHAPVPAATPTPAPVQAKAVVTKVSFWQTVVAFVRKLLHL